MTDRQLHILGIVITVAFFVVGGVVTALSDATQRLPWILIFAFLGSVPLVFMIARAVYFRVRGVHFVNDFGQYCRECRFMLQRAKDQNDVLTIQTPISLRPDRIPPGDKRNYDEYIGYTISRLISSNLRYRRIVVLRSGNAEPVEKIKDFLRLFVGAAVARERLHAAEATLHPFNLTNVTIGFVDAARSADSIYSNLDIHMTTEVDFAVAFLSKAPPAQEDFGGSLHLRDLRRRVSRRLRGEMDSLWGSIQRERSFVDMSMYYTAFDGQSAKSEAEQTHIIAALNAAVDAIAARAATPPPPAGGPAPAPP